MGIVAQHNTIWDVLTVEQSLDYICDIRGVPQDEKQFQIEFVKETLDLGKYSSTKSMYLSGGNKRKLICGMTLIGNPKIVFMDEPTTGVDPVSCRSLFKVLKNL